ncbi:MAG: glycosyltransferase family 1 protein [Coxiella sp. (in: Bacteria)]|nr:MAG: glycosyltransferase family 1 protein [Coxiella sp. (in: g-proteobacteria)]
MSNCLLLVINNLGFLYSHRLQVALSAANSGYDVHVATYFDGKDELKNCDQITYHRIKFNRNSTNPLKDAPAFLQLISLYRRIKPTVIHHIGMKPILFGSLAARFFSSARYVNAISGLGYLFISTSTKAAIIRGLLVKGFKLGFSSPRCNFIFQNDFDRDEFRKRRIIRSTHQVTMIRGSGVDLDEFSSVTAHNIEPLVVLPARLLWDKGVGEFVAAARQLQHRVSARFILVGDVDLINPASVTRAQVAQWVEEGIVEHWGWRTDMDKVFQQADIVCLPSYREGMPKALLEAAASGCPIVTTDAPGCNDVVKHGENGFLVPVKDTDHLLERLETLINNPKLRTEMGRQSRLRAEQLFGITHVVEQHLTLYLQLINPSKRWISTE